MRPSAALCALLAGALASCRAPAQRTPATTAPPPLDCALVAPDGTAIGRIRGPRAGPWEVEAGGATASLDADGTLRSAGAPDLHLGPVADPCGA